ncbi:MAG: hypothetical protein IIB39_08460 [Candidatus Marinimicrobia bacterium]|nr:hypothetical protein [Candidatus Neomarinimicrobiota bacterium]
MVNKTSNVEGLFEDFKNQIKSIFGAELLSIYLYGSAARDEYIQGKSDINFLVIIQSDGLTNLSEVWEYLPRLRKLGIATPLVLTRSYVDSSLDTFPLEFLNMMEANSLIYGEAVLEELEINNDHLRLQIERELKSKLLSLRQGYMETLGSRDGLENLISISLTAFTAIFRGTLYIKNVDTDKGDSLKVFKLIEDTFKLRKGVFKDLYDVKMEVSKMNTAELISLTEEYMEAVRTIFKRVDEL